MAATRRRRVSDSAAGPGARGTPGVRVAGSAALLYGSALALLVATLLALHGTVLRWPFLSDDYIFLSAAREWRDLVRGLAESPNYFRPLGRELYFFGGYHLVGPRPLAFHLANFAILAATVVLVATFARRLAGPRAGVLAAAAYVLLYPHRVLLAWVSCAQDLIATALALVAVLAWLGGRAWPAAGAYLAGMLAKESVAPLPLVLTLADAWSRRAERGAGARLGPALKRTATLWVAAAVWALTVLALRAGRHAAAPGASLAVTDVSLDPGALREGLRSALLVFVYLDQPWAEMSQALREVAHPWAAIGMLALVAWIGHRLSADAPAPWRAGPGGEVRSPAKSGAGASSSTHPGGEAPSPARLGLVWLFVGAVPAALAGHHFSAYYVSFMAIGFALLVGTLLARAPKLVSIAVFPVGAILAVAANEVTVFRATRPGEVLPGASWVTHVRLRREQVFLDSLQAAMRRDPPPRGARVYLIDPPAQTDFTTAGFRAAAVWFDDPALEMTTIGRYRPGAETRPARFVRFDPSRRGFVPLPGALVDAMLDGDAAMNRGDPRAARTVLERALAIARGHGHEFERIEIENTLGLASARLGDTASARRAWHAILARDPHHRGVLTNLAMLEADAGDYDGARRLTRRLLSRHPDDRLGLGLLVALDRALGDTAAARRDWQRLVAAHPGFADSLARAGGP